MTVGYGPSIVTNGLTMLVDAANPRSYPGSGTTWYDLSGNNNHLGLYNGVTFNNNGMLSYFNFNGTSQYASSNAPSGSTGYTIIMTAALTSISTNGFLWCTSTVLPGFASFAGFFFFYAGKSAYFSPAVSPTTSLYQYAFTYDGSTAFMYENSILVGSNSTSQAYAFTGLLLGGYVTADYCPINIYQASSYNRPLGPNEIAQNFNATRGRYGQ